MCESSVPDWFYHSIADYTDADTDRDHDIKWFLDAVARVVDVAEDGKSFTFKPKAKQKYFERQYHAFLDKACELTGISLDAFVGEAKYDIGINDLDFFNIVYRTARFIESWELTFRPKLIRDARKLLDDQRAAAQQ